jgi:hypothetical protein
MENRIVIEGELKGAKQHFRNVKVIDLKSDIRKNCLTKIYQKIKKIKN